MDGLYQIDNSSFISQIIKKFTNCRVFSALQATSKQDTEAAVDIWHLRLGHASLDCLSHISDIVINSSSKLCEVFPFAKQQTCFS